MALEIDLIVRKFLRKDAVSDELPVFIEYFAFIGDFSTCLLFVELGFFK